MAKILATFMAALLTTSSIHISLHPKQVECLNYSKYLQKHVGVYAAFIIRKHVYGYNFTDLARGLCLDFSLPYKKYKKQKKLAG